MRFVIGSSLSEINKATGNELNISIRSNKSKRTGIKENSANCVRIIND